MPLNQTILLRLAAFIVDSLTLALLLILPAAAVSYSLVLLSASTRAVSWVWYVAMLALAIGLLFRDGYRGRSPGKRLLGLRLLTPGSRPCTYGRSVLRNLPLVVPGWIVIEVLMVLFGRHARRSGDRLAGTTVVEE